MTNVAGKEQLKATMPKFQAAVQRLLHERILILTPNALQVELH
jgi:hypothetical protein